MCKGNIGLKVFPVIFAACFSMISAVETGATITPQKLKFSYSQRIRIETTDNAMSFNSDAGAGYSWVRHRTSLMMQGYPRPRLEIGLKITNEMRYFFNPEARKFRFDEIFFDLLYIKGDSLGKKPVSLTLGRQNIVLGEGFIIQDGSPLDGSRSAYFNAVRADWNFRPGHNLSFMYIYQPDEDNLLPIIHDLDFKLSEQDEEVFAAYYSGKVGKIDLQGYFFEKSLKPDTLASSHIYCPGIRVQAPLAGRLTATAEAAGQFGDWREVDHKAFGGYTYLEYKTGWPVHYPRSFTLGGLYLSGDNLTTAEHEGWEPMFSRWPKWSDGYLYTLVKEGGVGYWTNLAAVYAKTTADIIPGLTFDFNYYHMLAVHRADQDLSFPGGEGKSRGELFLGKLTFTMNEHFGGHVLWESFDPGDYYFSGADSFGWMRMEVMIKF